MSCHGHARTPSAMPQVDESGAFCSLELCSRSLRYRTLSYAWLFPLENRSANSNVSRPSRVVDGMKRHHLERR